MVHIDDQIPSSALHAEVVLYVRRRLRQAVRHRSSDALESLAMLFGLDVHVAGEYRLDQALESPTPIAAAADIIGRRRRTNIVALAYDEVFVERCHWWLLKAKGKEPEYARIVAHDLATLVTLERARELAIAPGLPGDQGKSFLPILLTGPTGSGKELLAEAIHKIWIRELSLGNRPFKVVQVSGLSTDMINDELFGHVKSAYTGASAERKGRLEEAEGGTVLIDEVGDLPPDAQLRLLRVVQHGVISRLGENRERAINVRIIAATWHDLERRVDKKKFRLDLLHRLKGAHLDLPALTKRNNFFSESLDELLVQLGATAVPAISRTARDALSRQKWTGNLRELNTTLVTALAISPGDTIRIEALPPDVQRNYITLPLCERAVAYLLEVEDGQMTDSSNLLRWRMSQVEASVITEKKQIEKDDLTSASRASDSTLPWRRAVGFLEEIDDIDPAHGILISALKEQIRRDESMSSIHLLNEYWCDIKQDLDSDGVREYVIRRIEQLRVAESKLSRHPRREEARRLLQDSEWWRLYLELEHLPILKGFESGAAAGGLIVVLRLFQSIEPSALAEIKALIRSKGLRGFASTLWQAIDTLGTDSSQDSESEAVDPNDWLPAEWQNIMNRYPSRASAAQGLQVDSRKIKKCILRAGLKEQWRTSGVVLEIPTSQPSGS